jgi:hypothetical protein
MTIVNTPLPAALNDPERRARFIQRELIELEGDTFASSKIFGVNVVRYNHSWAVVRVSWNEIHDFKGRWNAALRREIALLIARRTLENAS